MVKHSYQDERQRWKLDNAAAKAWISCSDSGKGWQYERECRKVWKIGGGRESKVELRSYLAAKHAGRILVASHSLTFVLGGIHAPGDYMKSERGVRTWRKYSLPPALFSLRSEDTSGVERLVVMACKQCLSDLKKTFVPSIT